MNKKNYLILITLILLSCSKKDSINNDGGCRLMFSDGIYLKTSSQKVLENSDLTWLGTLTDSTSKDTIVYRTRYFYNKQNQLEKREKYTYSGVVMNGYQTFFAPHLQRLQSTDSLSYDNQGRLSILYTILHAQITNYYVYKYEGSNKKASTIEYYYGSNKKLIDTKKITYDTQNRIQTTVLNNTTSGSNSSFYRIKSTTKYTYTNNNLAKIESFGVYNDDTQSHSIQKFENYDSSPNLLKNLPFIDLRGISESENNYREYSQESIYSKDGFPHSSSGHGGSFLQLSKEECN